MREVDVLASLSKYIHEIVNDVAVHSARKLSTVIKDDITRKRTSKYFGIGKIDRSTTQMGFKGFIDNDRWVVVYLGKDEADVRRIVDELGNNLMERKTIIGYLYDMSFPVFRVTLIEDINKVPVPTGTYEIAVSGIRTFNGIQEETKISESISVVVPDNNYIIIQFPKIPISESVFDHYNVYVKDNNLWKRVGQVKHEKRTLNLKTSINSLLPENPEVVYNESALSLVPFKNIQILAVSTQVREKPNDDDFWVGHMVIDLFSFGYMQDKNEPILGRITINLLPENF